MGAWEQETEKGALGGGSHAAPDASLGFHPTFVPSLPPYLVLSMQTTAILGGDSLCAWNGACT